MAYAQDGAAGHHPNQTGQVATDLVSMPLGEKPYNRPPDTELARVSNRASGLNIIPFLLPVFQVVLGLSDSLKIRNGG